MAISSENQKGKPDQIGIAIDQCRDLQSWVRTLQKALTVEVDRNFIDVVGRNEHFHEFVSRKIVSRISELLPSDVQQKLKRLSVSYKSYLSMTIQERRRLIIDSRQYLHSLKSFYEQPSDYNPPRLLIEKTINGKVVNNSLLKNQLCLESKLSVIQGVGPKMIEKLAALGLFTVRDIIFYYPRDYVDYSSLKRINNLDPGETVTIVGSVRRCSSFTSPKNSNLSILELHITDCSGRIKVTKFFTGRRHSNISFLKTQERLYPPNTTVAVSGLVKDGKYGRGINDPIIEVLENTNSLVQSKVIGRLLPIYSLTEGLSGDRFRKLIETVLPLTQSIKETLSTERLRHLNFPSRSKALFDIHCPEDSSSLSDARKRLVFDEFLLLQLSLLSKRIEQKKCRTAFVEQPSSKNNLVDKFLSLLPFNLTSAQKRVISEINYDLERPEPMARLIQGDVGSGKTIVAISALLKAVQFGWQGVLMAPTEVLASQHYQTLGKWVSQLEVNIDLLTGSTKASRRKSILTDLSNGASNILVGTHALLEDPVQFARLGLVVVDEQHRFGVHQRNKLISKGLLPHLLSMTATPIPRTLALSLHGDLDVSQIDELPPNRTPIVTRLLNDGQKDSAYQLIRTEVLDGHQAFVVLPLIEESDKLELNSAIDVYHELSTVVFPEFSVGLLHGRMQSTEKQSIIKRFVEGECNILVSTTVIEVGVDVPNASVMLIDNADRFGLAQLHQLRGRVGRGASKSHCILIYKGKNNSAKEKLAVLANSNDGFEISEIDLRLRGPGQFLGTKQSGLPDFVLANLVNDSEILDLARCQAKEILSQDPELVKHVNLKQLMNQQWDALTLNNQLN